MTLLIKNGRLINPATGTDGKYDVFIRDSKIEKVLPKIEEAADRVIDAAGMWVTPGFIDVHVHLRDPGFEYKETIRTGTRSAAMGGFTTICCMPNTDPVIDSEIMVEYVKMKAERDGVVHVLPIGAITKGQNGDELANIGQMAKAGACAVSEDGKSVMSAGMLKTAMSYAKMFHIPVLSHCEDRSLVAGGVMNAGPNAQAMGLKGISNDSEEVIVARDIILAKSTGVRLHICHVSTAGSVDIIRTAQEKGVFVSAEVCPHHFTLSDDAITDYNGNTKMNPPLRSKEDVEAIREGLRDDTIRIIATDHAPHSADEKNCEYDKAAFGIVGLETALPLALTELVDTGVLSPYKVVEKMAYRPAALLGIDKGSVEPGKDADLIIIDPECRYTVDVERFQSKSKNSPFHGKAVRGKVLYTIVDGNIVVCDGELIEEEKL